MSSANTFFFCEVFTEVLTLKPFLPSGSFRVTSDLQVRRLFINEVHIETLSRPKPMLCRDTEHVKTDQLNLHELVLFKAQLTWTLCHAPVWALKCRFSIFLNVLSFPSAGLGTWVPVLPLKCRFWGLSAGLAGKRWKNKKNRSTFLGKPLRAVP